ncbi:gp50 [Sodalis phage SO-1]|uniref:Gp50 n=1 Tax=Sodalis phage SO-1 TaxID=673375 RepID=C9EHE0_9CAUD|nr:gp50 [Sodalis phage SO1]ACV84142.1 gp50 [Sodalis phage SO1]
MKALIWNYSLAVAKLDEAKALNGNVDQALHVAILAHQSLRSALYGMAEIQPLANAIQDYALAFARERLAYRFGIGETAVTNVARIKAQRELFAQLAK